jgi:histidyl-tRNA synthetase
MTDMTVDDAQETADDRNPDIQNIIEEFKKREKIRAIIAFSGGADHEDDEESRRVIQEAIRVFRSHGVAILTGGTEGGIPQIASTEAKNSNLPTVGIFPKRAKKVLKNLDLAIPVEAVYGQSDWGDESALFAKVADAIIVIGGGAGTTIELAHAMKINEGRIAKAADSAKKVNSNTDMGANDASPLPIFIVPIKGFGPVADIFEAARIFKPFAIQKSLPTSPNYKSGSEAAHFLLSQLGLTEGSKATISSPRTLAVRQLEGCDDLMPAEVLQRKKLVDVIERIVESFGFVPIQTPAMEHTDLLDGIAGEKLDAQIFRFVNSNRKSVSLRYDLTLPLAKFFALHNQKLRIPFKRYEVGAVWRMETQTEENRLTQFTQFDFDIVGSGSRLAELEIVQLLHTIFTELRIPKFKIRINNWKLWTGIFEKIQAQDKLLPFLSEFDHQYKSRRSLEEILSDLGRTFKLSDDGIATIQDFLSLPEKEGAGIFDGLGAFLSGSSTGLQGIGELKELHDSLVSFGMNQGELKVDIALTRGSFAYYTGLLCEVSQGAGRETTSLGGGGRYDNLLNRFLNQKEVVPAVGASITLELLLEALKNMGLAAGLVDVLIGKIDQCDNPELMKVGSALRNHGIKTAFYYGADSSEKQVQYAKSQGAQIVVRVSSNLGSVTLELLNLLTGDVITGISTGDITASVRQQLEKNSQQTATLRSADMHWIA